MNDRNITMKKTGPFKAKFPEVRKTKAPFNPSASDNSQQQMPSKAPRTEHSVPQNTDITLRNFWHMKLCVK